MSTENFKESIKQWVVLDNEHKQYNDKVKQIREKKTQVLDVINTHVQSNSLTNAFVQISDGRLKFTNNKSVKPLTLRYIEDCLSQLLSTTDTQRVMTYIKDNREYTYSDDIKRYYK